MKRRKWKKILRSRGTMWVLLGCLAAGAVSGTIYKNRVLPDMEQAAGTDSFDMGSDAERVNGSGNADSSMRNEEEKSAGGESILAAGEKNGEADSDVNDKTADGSSDKNTSEILAANGAADSLAKKDDEPSEKKDIGKDDPVNEDDTSGLGKVSPASTLLQAQSLEFLKNDTISWPVQGEVLTEFNMEETVYHPTLNLYRCSPSMVIQSEYGTPVSAPADGLVLSVGNDEQIGNYIVMDLGSSYQITMGQLMDIHVSEGDLVNEGDLIAYIAQPTACYSVEGDNLYLSMTADEVPVDPLDYLVY